MVIWSPVGGAVRGGLGGFLGEGIALAAGFPTSLSLSLALSLPCSWIEMSGLSCVPAAAMLSATMVLDSPQEP